MGLLQQQLPVRAELVRSAQQGGDTVHKLRDQTGVRIVRLTIVIRHDLGDKNTGRGHVYLRTQFMRTAPTCTAHESRGESDYLSSAGHFISLSDSFLSFYFYCYYYSLGTFYFIHCSFLCFNYLITLFIDLHVVMTTILPISFYSFLCQLLMLGPDVLLLLIFSALSPRVSWTREVNRVEVFFF